MKKFTLADYTAMPWKNGGGVTTQLAIEPAGADLNNFDWRISTAQVASAGPFSLFAGVDRSIAVVQGGGMAFDLGGMHITILTPENRPFVFRGEQHVHATLLNGPVSDFNVMTRRSRCAHELQAVRLSGTLQWTLSADLTFVYCASGDDLHCSGSYGESVRCAAGDTLMFEPGDGDLVEFFAPSGASLYIVSLMFKENSNAG